MSASDLTEGDVVVNGNASADDVAAVLAVLRGLAARAPDASPYDRWRAQRIAALRSRPPR